ncbi:MAG TPA: hypothetical protein VEI07_09515 [Planctomycetaceae bacterium]|nr:hypothetical protein [Planctomycetaceae bacterium]
MTTVRCPHCAANLNAPPEYEGRKVKCTNCGKSFVLRFPTRSASTGGSTMDLFDEDEAAPPIIEPPTSVKMSITVEPWRAAVYQQVADERYGRDLSAFARVAFDALAEQLGYTVKSADRSER